MSSGTARMAEDRITRLERLYKEQFGSLTFDYSAYPVRNLTLTEENNTGTDGITACVLVATWTSPAGNIMPQQIRINIGDIVEYTSGSALVYRIYGHVPGETVTVGITALYANDKFSSTITAAKTLTGDSIAPGVPFNAAVSSGFRTLTISWTNPADNDLLHTEVWESREGDNIETAERIAQAYGIDFVRANCDVMETRWYWLRAVDKNDNKSDFIGPYSATTQALEMEDIPEQSISESKFLPRLQGLADEIKQLANASILSGVNAWDDRETAAIATQTLDTKVTEGLAAEATARLLVAAKAGENAAAILQEAAARATVDGKVEALYTLRVDANGRLAGFALGSDGTVSECAFIADKFKIAKADGSLTQIFTVDTDTGLVQIVGDLIASGSLTGNEFNVASQIQLGAGGRFLCGDGSIFQMGSGAVLIDSETGRLRLTDPDNLITGKYTEITTGTLKIYQYLNSAYREMQTLKKVEVGTNVQNGTVITLPGYWPSLPKVLVSPCLLQCYKGGYQSQDHFLSTQAADITWNPTTGMSTFRPLAKLIKGGGTTSNNSVTAASGELQTGSISNWYPTTTVTTAGGAQTLPLNTNSITITGKVFGQYISSKLIYDEADSHYEYFAHELAYELYLNVDGNDNLMAAGTLPKAPFSASGNYISDPTSRYISYQKTFTLNKDSQHTVYLKAKFTPTGSNTSLGRYGGTNKGWIQLEGISTGQPGENNTLAEGTLNYMAIAE